MEYEFQGWITLWKWMLVVCMFLFGLLAVGVTIGGFLDIKKLFKTLASQHGESPDEDTTS